VAPRAGHGWHAQDGMRRFGAAVGLQAERLQAELRPV
jgi:hypothetical protein